MNADQLSGGRQYVGHARQYGYTDAQIMRYLRQSGWSSQQIEELSRTLAVPLGGALRPPLPPAPPPPPPPEPAPRRAPREVEMPPRPVESAVPKARPEPIPVTPTPLPPAELPPRTPAPEPAPPQPIEPVPTPLEPSDREPVFAQEPYATEAPAPELPEPEHVRAYQPLIPEPPAPEPPREEPVAPPETPEPEPVTAAEAAMPATPAPQPPSEPPPQPPPPTEPPKPPAPPRPGAPGGGIEVAIGTAWLTRIGMVAVILAAAYLLGWAYNEGHISPAMMIVAGILTGIAVMVGGEWSHRRDFEVQSQALTGGGAALLYLTLWAAQHLYHLADSALTFPAMAVVTAAAAVQAVRHRSETIATLAWITGYAVPLLIGGSSGGGGVGGSDAPALFGYLTLLSVAVFVVAQRHAWPTFTGLALMGAYASGGYIFRVSDGALGWTLTYLMLVTAGMLWVSVSRRGREGERFGAVGAVAGYLATGVVLLSQSSGSPFVPYLYLLALSGSALLLGHMQDWRSLRWLGALGSFVGFLMLLPLMGRAGGVEATNWMLLYAAVSVAGVLGISTRGRGDAEPLAITAVLMAYVTATILVAGAAAVSGGVLVAYLLALAAAVMVVKALYPWTTFAVIGTIAAFVATALLRTGPEVGVLYLALVGASALAVSAWRDDRRHGTIAILGIFVALPMAGAMGYGELMTPVYLALAAIATLGAISWRRWWGLEWVALIGTWGLYLIWRGAANHGAPDDGQLGFTVVYVLSFLAAGWARHGALGEEATATDAALAAANAAACFAFGWYDLHELQAAGALALGLTALYAAAGVAGIRRRPGYVWFGPFLVGLSVFFLTGAGPLLTRGYHMTVWWATEVVLLMGLSFGFRARGLRDGALVVLMLPLLRAIAVDSHISAADYQLLANPRALSMLAVIAAMYVSGHLYVRLRDRLGEREGDRAPGLLGAATVLLLWIASIETWDYVGLERGLDLWAQQYALSGVWVLFGATMMLIGVARNLAVLRGSALALWAITAFKVLAIDPLLTPATYVPLLHHRVGPLIAITALVYAAAAWYARAREEERALKSALVAAATGLLLWVASSEAWLLVGWELGYGRAAQHFALSGVWVVFGAALLGIGMARGQMALRWAGLSLLAVTAVKVLVGEPALDPATYWPLINAHTAPLLAIAAVLFGASVWYRDPERIDESEAGATPALLAFGTVLLLWVLSVDAWRTVGWMLAAGEAAQYAVLSAVWIVFSMVLVVLGVTRDSAPLRWSALALLGLTVLKVLGLEPALERADYVPLLNAHALPLTVVAAMIFALVAWYARGGRASGGESAVRTALLVAATGLVMWVASTESWLFLGWRTSAGTAGQQMALSLIWLIFGAVMLIMGMERNSGGLRAIGLVTVGLVIGKVLLVDESLTERTYRLLANHYAFPLLLGAALLYLASHYYRRHADEVEGAEEMVAATLPYAASVLVWWVVTTEAWHFAGWSLGGGADARQYALSAAWTLFGAVLLTVGLVRGNPPLRWMAMGLLAITVVKVFFLDLRALDIVYRILALASLGVVLIALGFGYQRLVREQGGDAPHSRHSGHPLPH